MPAPVVIGAVAVGRGAVAAGRAGARLAAQGSRATVRGVKKLGHRSRRSIKNRRASGSVVCGRAKKAFSAILWVSTPLVILHIFWMIGAIVGLGLEHVTYDACRFLGKSVVECAAASVVGTTVSGYEIFGASLTIMIWLLVSQFFAIVGIYFWNLVNPFRGNALIWCGVAMTMGIIIPILPLCWAGAVKVSHCGLGNVFPNIKMSRPQRGILRIGRI